MSDREVSSSAAGTEMWEGSGCVHQAYPEQSPSQGKQSFV